MGITRDEGRLAGELRQGAVMTVRLIPVVGRHVLLRHAGCASRSFIACRCPVVWWEFLQANGHDQPGLTAFTGHNDVSDRCGSQRSGGDVPDNLRVTRPGVVDVVREGKHLLKRCLHIGHMGVVPGSVSIPVRRFWQSHCEQVVGMIDSVSLVRVHGYVLSSLAVWCCIKAS